MDAQLNSTFATVSAVQQHQASVASGGPESNHVDEESVQNAHNEAYSNNNASSLGSVPPHSSHLRTDALTSYLGF